MNDKKGSVSIYIMFMIVAIVIVTIAAVLAPLGVLFNSEMYAAGEYILSQSNESIDAISNEAVKASVQSNIAESLDSAENNININADIFQYGWVAIVFLSFLVVFMFTRQLVEVGAGGFI
jgi:hypothetical protein